MAHSSQLSTDTKILDFKPSPCPNVAFFLLGDSPVSEFYCILVHMTYEDGTERSKRSAHENQTSGNRPKEWLQEVATNEISDSS